METNKKISTYNKIVIAAVVGGAGYLIYSNWDKIKKMFDKKAEPKKDEATKQSSGSGASTTGAADSTYKQSVMLLQELLGVAVDGSAGKQTNGQLEYYFCDFLCQFEPEKAFSNGYPFLKKNGQGVVSPSNVIFYIKALQTGNTPRQLLIKGVNVQQKLKEFKDSIGL